MRNTFMTGGLAVAAILLAAATPPRAEAKEGATLSAMEIAYGREVSARAHYELFAKVAMREGHPEICALFLAAARGEAVHAANHRRVLEWRGRVARAEIGSVVVRPTAANLVFAIENERKENELVYRAWSDLARAECDYEALASFNYARNAEATHARMFADALARLRSRRPAPTLLASLTPVLLPEPWPETGPAGFTCPGCGSVFHDRPARSCPNCGTAGSGFIVFLVHD